MVDQERIILHIDINHCYAQIEEMLNPQLKKVAMAIGGDEERRHGIILARNLLAKPFMIKTGEPIRDAMKKCPHLHIVPPNMKLYEYYTSKVKDIYREYSNQVESFGLDEAWVDVTHSQNLFGSGYEIAKIIQQRVLDEIGLTVSIGVSFNKIFAKLGSDLIKPSGLVEITRHNYKEAVWPLPVQDLLMIGKATQVKLNRLGIFTIGELAQAELKEINQILGKMGVMIWSFANGIEDSDVDFSNYEAPAKSIGNSWTTPKDITNFQEAKIVLKVLAESVASRLRDQHFKGKVISLNVRNKKLYSFTRQVKLLNATDVSNDILNQSLQLLYDHYDFHIPIRSIGITVSQLSDAYQHLQLNLFEQYDAKMNQRKVDIVIDQIRQKHGYQSIYSASMLLDVMLSGFNPKGDHTVFPVGFLKGSISS